MPLGRKFPDPRSGKVGKPPLRKVEGALESFLFALTPGSSLSLPPSDNKSREEGVLWTSVEVGKEPAEARILFLRDDTFSNSFDQEFGGNLKGTTHSDG